MPGFYTLFLCSFSSLYPVFLLSFSCVSPLFPSLSTVAHLIGLLSKMCNAELSITDHQACLSVNTPAYSKYHLKDFKVREEREKRGGAGLDYGRHHSWMDGRSTTDAPCVRVGGRREVGAFVVACVCVWV
eukprot:GHVU01118354.1.p1 GENE.GHVU01118354.1~~GHVU01118354.1.p1  ORF type:complete len:130 (+),score=14.61 GHVU01118354.1:371-760(+)